MSARGETSDRISKKEAIIIAQRFFVEKGLDREVELARARVHKKFQRYVLPDGSDLTERPERGEYTEQQVWDVIFPMRREGTFSLTFHMFVWVNVKTGTIEEYGTYKW